MTATRVAPRPVSAPDRSITALLREASEQLDRMWRQALHGGHVQSAIRLGEASQGVHRALIALERFVESDGPDSH